ncbi:Ankyrin-3 [Phytophthora citrophthora]|uniref:Ankyrin-3 n=1 Tax=Phytophthora citrophthora TaxID=4793 RepID=A0AAD9GV45_9STRA|nr:Ankyrin-3 [Phytophthora citrophthora]
MTVPFNQIFAMSWLQMHEVTIPFYEGRPGKQVFAIQLHERALRQEELARNWSSITSTSSQQFLLEENYDDSSSMIGSTSGTRVTAKRSYSQFRKLWKDLIRATKTPSTSSLSRSNSTESTHTRPSSNRSLANSFHSLPVTSGESTSSCRCRNWNCTFRSFHYFLKSYPFPSKFLLKRNSPAVLENRRQGLELFITTVRGLFDTFPRPFLQSVDELGKCQVLAALNVFFGLNEKQQLNSTTQTTLQMPLASKLPGSSRCSRSNSVTSESTTCFSSSSQSVTSSKSNADTALDSNEQHSEDPLYGGIEYYLREDDAKTNSDFELQDVQDLSLFGATSADRTYLTSPRRSLQKPKKLQSTGRRSRYYRGISIRRHTTFLARNPTMSTRSGSTVSSITAPQTLLPGLPKVKPPSDNVSSIRSFLDEFRDHLLLDSQALGNSAEGWNEDRQWELALYVASQIGHAYAVESVLYRGTSPNAVMEDGLTSLHAACRGGHRSIVAMLLTHGADANITDIKGVSPLISAVQLGDLEIVEMLVEYGANVNLCNNDSVSAVHVAVACQTLPVLQFLLDYDAFVNTKNAFNGKTPLHLAAQSGNLPICKLLLNYGASVHLETARGFNVAALAKSHGHEIIARFCLDFGSNQKIIHRESSNVTADASTDEVRIVSEDGHSRSAANNASHGAGSAAPINNSECWDSVSYLESAFHHGFMRLRLKTGDFVYHEDPRLTRELDEFCDVDSMHTPKGPVILLGESGMGKSAFLANWLVRRKKMFQNWQSSYPEFIFSHVVGCSRQSCSVSNLLERILREIKEYFELNKEIPDVEERLSWQFPRFLEAASKKGRVILVVDGLHRLHTNNGESILKWVPLSFPPNVRIIFSGTLNYPTAKLLQPLNVNPGAGQAALIVPRGDEGGHDECGVGGDYYEKTSLSAQMIERIKVEAGRRNWKLIQVLPLVEEDRRRIVKKFISKNRDTIEHDEDGLPRKVMTGLQLFEIQQNAIVGVPMSTCPHFMKNFLIALLWAVKEGFNIHAVFESWLGADSVAQLLESILRSMEVGYTPDQLSTDDAMQFLSEFDGEDPVATSSIANVASIRKLSSTFGDAQLPEFSGRRNSHHRNESPAKIELARAAAEAAVRETSDSLDFHPQEDAEPTTHTGVNEMKRVKSVHETKELFVNMARTDGARTQLSATEGSGAPPVDSYSSAKGSTTNALLEAAQYKLKRFSTEPRAGSGGINKKGSRPDYLTGGRTVRPLGELLGRALCLLYVSRHGLLQNELRFILNAIVTEARGSNSLRKHEEGTPFSRKTTIGQERLTAFSEDEWQALLRALRTLSILFVQEVVVLPMCKDILRDVIWWRYIGSERAEQQYHQWLIRFFRIHPTTFRRVEELPWHLKRCYQWDALRQVLVNLPMFQLLYTANYKAELFGYWKVLTDGPLLNYGAATSASDSAVYVTPFDVVKEYGKSIDDWYRGARPTTKVFTAIVQLVTRFMYEFCLSYQRPLPQFTHAPFDLKRLYLDGFLFVENLPHVQIVGNSASAPPGNSSLGGLPSVQSQVATASSALLAALDNFPPQVHISSIGTASLPSKDKDAFKNCFFFYQRWIWIHFPWLALSREIIIRDPVIPNPILDKANNYGAGISNPGLPPTMTQAASSSSLIPVGSGRGRPGEGIDEEVRRHDGDGNTSKAATLTPSQSTARSALFDARFWDVKKSMFDPTTRRPRGAMTTSQLAAVKNASVLMTSASTSQINKTLDVISPENLYRKKTAYSTVKGVLASSVRRLPSAALKSSASLPSLSEQPAITVNQNDSASKNDSQESPIVNRSASVSSPLPLVEETNGKSMPSKELKLDSISSTEDLLTVATSFGLPAHFQDYPQSDWDLKQSYNHRVVLKLQTLYDTVKTEVAQKQKYLDEVKRKIRETARRYDLTMRECDMAKHAAEEMSSRLAKLEHVMKNIDHQEKTHRKLIRGCELFPACAPTHFDTNKKELRLLQMKLRDLQAEKKVLHTKKTHLQNEELPLLRKTVDKSKRLLSAVVDKLERAREKVAHDQASSDKLYQRRLEMIESVRTATGKGSNSTTEEDARRQIRQTFSATTRSLAAKVALQQCEAMCEKIQKATGFSKMELILQKFTRREELNASFEEQAKLYEARLKQIKLNQAELEEQLHSLELSQVTASTEDPRLLEQKLRAAEVELARAEYTQASLLTSSKEVIAGAARIVKLMGITNCFDPHQNAIPASRLWPPPVGYEGENSLTSEFETLEPPAITSLLQLCQDRATLMIDAIEGARSDPDVNFSLIADSTVRNRRRTVRGGDEKTTARSSRYRRTPQLSSVVEKSKDKEKDRVGFDRGAVPPLAAAISAVMAAMTTQSSVEEGEQGPSEEADVLSREAIKTSSRNKLAQRKRGNSNVGPGDIEHHDHRECRLNVNEALPNQIVSIVLVEMRSEAQRLKAHLTAAFAEIERLKPIYLHAIEKLEGSTLPNLSPHSAVQWFEMYLRVIDLGLQIRRGEIRHRTIHRFKYPCMHTTGTKGAVHSGLSIDDGNAIFCKMKERKLVKEKRLDGWFMKMDTLDTDEIGSLDTRVKRCLEDFRIQKSVFYDRLDMTGEDPHVEMLVLGGPGVAGPILAKATRTCYSPTKCSCKEDAKPWEDFSLKSSSPKAQKVLPKRGVGSAEDEDVGIIDIKRQCGIIEPSREEEDASLDRDAAELVQRRKLRMRTNAITVGVLKSLSAQDIYEKKCKGNGSNPREHITEVLKVKQGSHLLNLSSIGFHSADDLQDLVDVFSTTGLPPVKELDLSNGFFDFAAFRVLLQLLRIPLLRQSIEKLSLRGLAVPKREDFARIVGLLTGDSNSSVGNLPVLSNLRTLDLSFNTLRYDEMVQLPPLLSSLPRLEVLSLESCFPEPCVSFESTSDEKAVVETIRHALMEVTTRLERLNFGSNCVATESSWMDALFTPGSTVRTMDLQGISSSSANEPDAMDIDWQAGEAWDLQQIETLKWSSNGAKSFYEDKLLRALSAELQSGLAQLKHLDMEMIIAAGQEGFQVERKISDISMCIADYGVLQSYRFSCHSHNKTISNGVVASIGKLLEDGLRECEAFALRVPQLYIGARAICDLLSCAILPKMGKMTLAVGLILGDQDLPSSALCFQQMQSLHDLTLELHAVAEDPSEDAAIALSQVLKQSWLATQDEKRTFDRSAKAKRSFLSTKQQKVGKWIYRCRFLKTPAP